MKKTYLKPAMAIEKIEVENVILAGSTKIEKRRLATEAMKAVPSGATKTKPIQRECMKSHYEHPHALLSDNKKLVVKSVQLIK